MKTYYCAGCDTYFETRDTIAEPFCVCCGQQEDVMKEPHFPCDVKED